MLGSFVRIDSNSVANPSSFSVMSFGFLFGNAVAGKLLHFEISQK